MSKKSPTDYYLDGFERGIHILSLEEQAKLDADFERAMQNPMTDEEFNEAWLDVLLYEASLTPEEKAAYDAELERMRHSTRSFLDGLIDGHRCRDEGES